MNGQQLIDALHETCRRRHLSRRTEEAYLYWLRQYAAFCAKNAWPSTEDKITAFLSRLATKRNVSASTQNQALNALAFLYRDILREDLGDFSQFRRAKRSRRLPVVLSQEEVSRLLAHLTGIHWLIGATIYGTGMRLNEALSIRVKDIDFDRSAITVRAGKGNKDRTVMLPASLAEPMRQQVATAERNHNADMAAGYGSVYLPHAIARKYPNADREFAWQYVFQASRVGPDPETGEVRRHHIHETAFQKAIRRAVRRAGINKKVGAHTLRHSFATHLVERGESIRNVQELLGHKSINTTMVYLHVSTRGVASIASPLETIAQGAA